MMSLLRLFSLHAGRVVFASPAQRTQHTMDLPAEDIECVDILLNDASFDEFVTSLAPDYVLFDRFMMEEQFSWRVEKACPDCMRILDTEDLQCLRTARRTAFNHHRNVTQTDLMTDLAKREIAAILRCDLSLIISQYEIQLLQQTYKVDASLLHYLPFMLKPPWQFSRSRSFSQRQHFVTIGNFRHAPNWDSVQYLQQIWPSIRSRIPDAELHIYGAYASKKVSLLNNPKTGFLVKGRAESAFEVLSNARVCIAPLRFGAGLKGKLTDAMQVATPSVTTDIGAEAMTGELPWPGIIANSADEIANAAVALYENESLWLECQGRIRSILSQQYDAERLGEMLISHIESVKANLQQHRANNFTGGMLNYHLLKSSQYMSQWIEAKTALQKLDDA